MTARELDDEKVIILMMGIGQTKLKHPMDSHVCLHWGGFWPQAFIYSNIPVPWTESLGHAMGLATLLVASVHSPKFAWPLSITFGEWTSFLRPPMGETCCN